MYQEERIIYCICAVRIFHSHEIADGTLYGVGKSRNLKQLGFNRGLEHIYKIEIKDYNHKVDKIVCGRYHSLILFGNSEFINERNSNNVVLLRE